MSAANNAAVFEIIRFISQGQILSVDSGGEKTEAISPICISQTRLYLSNVWSSARAKCPFQQYFYAAKPGCGVTPKTIQ